ncbi:MAG: ABC transporter substrate-binding protein [Desulfotomaculaceae bacterium]|nr:ABC transporter substrate-binding protein [Desulfotomaculaceae bacterium]
MLLVGLLAAGCAKNETVVDTPADSIKDTGFVTVTDFIGRQVKVPDQVERIGCLYAYTGHVVTMLGRGSDIVAVVEGLKRDVMMTEMSPGIKDAVVPSAEGAINIEELIKADPDLVFIRNETAQSEGEIEKLEKSGIPYLVVDYRNIKEQMYTIEMIGKAIGAHEQAKEYNDYYQHCIDLVQARVAGIPEKERVTVYHSVNEATRTDAKDTLPADWLKVAGVNNVSINENLKLLGNKYFASLEQILMWDPEVILANEAGVADYMMTNRQWSALRAVKNNKVYQMPNGVSRWGHPGSLETPLAILWTAKTIYPDRFTDLDMVAETKTFYKDYFRYEVSDDEVASILSGVGMRAKKEGKRI